MANVEVTVSNLPRENQEDDLEPGVTVVDSWKNHDWLDTWTATLTGPEDAVVRTLARWKDFQIQRVPMGEEAARALVKQAIEDAELESEVVAAALKG